MKPRGIFEKKPGSGIWYARYVDASGILRREKGGTKSAAIQLYRKRKTEALEGRKLPGKLRRPALSFADIAKEALRYSEAHKRTYSDDKQRMDRMLGWFKGRSAESITPQDIERHFAECVAEYRLGKGPRQWFEDAVNAAGIANFHWHDLRHTFASRLAMADVGIRAIQEALGHKSLAMTVRYSHLSPDFLQDAVDRLVPPQPETGTQNQTDTRTDTEALSSLHTPTQSVH